MKVAGALSALIVLAAAAVSSPAAAWNPFGVQGDGHKVTQARQVTGFKRVEIRGALDAEIKEGAFSVAVTADSNLQPLILTEVQGDTLVIRAQENIHPSKGSKAEIALPDFQGVTVSGAGDVDVRGISHANAVTLTVSGAGDVDYAGAAQSLEVDVSGAGDIKANLTGDVEKVSATVSGTGDVTLRGSAVRALQATVSGTGNLDAKELPAKAANAEVSGTGNIRATVQPGGKLNADLSGVGNLDWWGDAQEKHISSHGMGGATHHG